MNDATERGLRFSPTVVLILVVLALAVGALLSREIDGPAPGTVRLGVLAAESPRRVERAMRPLAAWIAQNVGRAGEVVAPGTAGLEELASRCDVMLVPESVLRGAPEFTALAWVRPLGSAGPLEEFVVVEAPDGGRRLCAVPVDSGVADLNASTGADCDSVLVAGSPFAERELLRAFVAGAFRAVVVRRSVVEDARLAGWLGDRPHTLTVVSPARTWMALVASPAADEDLARRVRDAALNLDKYRLDPSHARAASVLNSLAEFGIGGFAPVEPFAAFRR